MPLFQGFCPVAGTICPSLAAAVVGPSRAPQGMKKGRRPRRRPRLKLSDKAGPDQCPVPGENALFPAQIAGFLAVSRAVPVYPVFLNYVVPVQECRGSGLSVSEWCRQRGVTTATYYRWERELLTGVRKNGAPPSTAVTFAELPAPKQVSCNVAERCATLHIGSASLDIYSGCDAEQLKMLVNLLRLC